MACNRQSCSLKASLCFFKRLPTFQRNTPPSQMYIVDGTASSQWSRIQRILFCNGGVHGLMDTRVSTALKPEVYSGKLYDKDETRQRIYFGDIK